MRVGGTGVASREVQHHFSFVQRWNTPSPSTTSSLGSLKFTLSAGTFSEPSPSWSYTRMPGSSGFSLTLILLRFGYSSSPSAMYFPSTDWGSLPCTWSGCGAASALALPESLFDPASGPGCTQLLAFTPGPGFPASEAQALRRAAQSAKSSAMWRMSCSPLTELHSNLSRNDHTILEQHLRRDCGGLCACLSKQTFHHNLFPFLFPSLVILANFTQIGKINTCKERLLIIAQTAVFVNHLARLRVIYYPYYFSMPHFDKNTISLWIT